MIPYPLLHVRSVASRAAVAVCVLASLSGCVTRSSYEEVVAERDAMAADAGLYRMERDAVAVRATALRGELALRNREIAQLEQEQQELADEVARWAVLGAIRMKLLADGLHLTLPHDVLFKSGSAELKTEGREIVAELVGEIREEPYQITVLGFTDNVPVGPSLVDRFPSNWELAGARAASVVRVMEAEGIPPIQLLAVSRGETDPVASNDTGEGRAENRRIDIRMRPIVREE
jgi:chemotaxis protein MotB